MISKHRIAAAVAVVLTAMVAAGTALAQAKPAPPTADHWKLVPTFATTCYADDGFSETIEAARAAITAQAEKQDEINAAIKERLDKIEGMEKAQRMQAYMMKDPQAAMKMMQAQQAAAVSGQAMLEELQVSAARLEAELKRLQDAFRAATEQAVKPVLAKQDALIKAKTIPIGETATPAFTGAADHAQYLQLVAEENAAYERACAAYFGPNGSFHKWASSYRTEVTEKMSGDGSGDEIMIMQMQAMDVPAANYRNTTQFQQANEYLRRVNDIWRIRKNGKTMPSVHLVKR